MSTPATETPASAQTDNGQAPASTTPPANPPAAGPAQDDETDWRAEAKKWEARAKENFPKAQKYDELKDAEKTELERATARAEAAENETATLRTELLRREVAEAKGIPLRLAGRLTGTTREELEADADQLAELIGDQKTPPRPDTAQGRTRGGDAVSAREALARSILAPGR